MNYYLPLQRRAGKAQPFMFATGIENSYPMIVGRDGQPFRVDEMSKTDHYRRWREDFALTSEMGIDYLRYGPPYYQTHVAPGVYDWTFSDEVFAELRRLNITPIVDLCHFGVPEWIGNFQNPAWPAYFAEYARAFAERYPYLHLYTPVNEIYICAKFSALHGWWNERKSDDRSFVTALKHLVQANIMAEEAILAVQPTAYFIQSESVEYFHPTTPDPHVQELAEKLNQIRFLSLDLSYGYHGVGQIAYDYLLENGVSRSEYQWFMAHGRALRPHQIMGTDYYASNEHMVDMDGVISPAWDTFGYYLVTKDYYDRYRLPVMHTETNYCDVDQAPGWLWKQWRNTMKLRADGVPMVGFTWYSLIDQVDWDSALTHDDGHVIPLGLYDMDRQLRPVGVAYRRLIEQWQAMLPAEHSHLDLHAPLPLLAASAKPLPQPVGRGFLCQNGTDRLGHRLPSPPLCAKITLSVCPPCVQRSNH